MVECRLSEIDTFKVCLPFFNLLSQPFLFSAYGEVWKQNQEIERLHLQEGARVSVGIPLTQGNQPSLFSREQMPTLHMVRLYILAGITE